MSIAVPDECFRFTGEAPLKKQVKGLLRFGRLYRYRLLETVTGDQWIGDANEALATTLIDISLRAGDGNLDAREKLKAAGISVGENAEVTFTDCRTTQSLDCFVLSLSAGHFPTLEAAMCQATDRPNYNACFRLTDLSGMGHAIAAARYGAGRVQDAFYVHFGPVRYGEPAHDFGTQGVNLGDPFVKALKYRSQAEWRFVLVPKITVAGDFVSVDIADFARDHFEAVPVASLESGDATTTDRDQMTVEAALEIIRKEVDIREGPDRWNEAWRGQTEHDELCKAYWVLRAQDDQYLDRRLLDGTPRSLVVNDLHRRFMPDYGKTADVLRRLKRPTT